MANEPPGERLLPASRRPDGTLRKQVRIRAGYVAQDEVAIYQSKGSQIKNNSQLQVPPGYDPEDANKPKTKAAKRNEKRKEKKKQAKSNALESAESGQALANASKTEPVEALDQEMGALRVSGEASTEPSAETSGGKSEVEKRIRALKKKIRLASESPASEEAKLKLEGWKRELNELGA